MSTLTIQTLVREDSEVLLNNTVSHTIKSKVTFDEEVPDMSSDLEFLLAIDISALKYLMMLADQDLTIKTNDSGSPQETLSLSAGVPLTWNSTDAAILAGDVDKIFVSNSSGSATALNIVAAMDQPDT